MTLDLDDPAQNMRAFVKARASLLPEDVVVRFAGDVTAVVPDTPAKHLFAFDGYNVARAVEVDGGYDLLTREVVFYLDPRTGRPLDRWTNPFTEEDVDVVHIWNDPVNQRFRLQQPWGPWRVPSLEIAGSVQFKIDVFLAYPSPLPRAHYPEHSQDDTYRAAELFTFTTPRAELDTDTPSASCAVSWTRMAPWLPFMRMGDRPGMLVYHGRGAKLPGGYDELPAWIRERVRAAGRSFDRAPTEFTEPNETSWTYFKKLIDGASVS